MDLQQEIKEYQHWKSVCIFQEKKILASNNCENTNDIKKIEDLFEMERSEAIKSGLFYNNTHFDIHRFYNNMIYGRSVSKDIEEAEGFSIYRNGNIYGIVTYELPFVSAKIMPELKQLLDKYVTV